MSKFQKCMGSFVLMGFLVLGVGCSSVTIRDKGITRLSEGEAINEQSYKFYLWGLVGEQHINVTEICKGSNPKQIQVVHTVTDSLLTIVTFGIYAPRSVKVWCQE